MVRVEGAAVLRYLAGEEAARGAPGASNTQLVVLIRRRKLK
jgi:hypothetical protein